MNNPLVKGWYADPESRVYNNQIYIYVTKSLPYEEQTNIDLVVSKDMKRFEIIKDVLDMSTYKNATFAIWAPTVIEKDNKYYILFAANDIQKDEPFGGLYIGVSDTPEGKFRNVFPDGRPFLNYFINGAQPIDAHLYKDVDGQIYLYYGGWKHLNVCKMKDDMTGFVEETMREITPKNYTEAPFVIMKDGRYVLMYSTGAWGNGTYCVKAAYSNDIFGPFIGDDTVLSASELADGPGHNSAFAFNGETYIAYHRRIIGDPVWHHRMLCIDKMEVESGRVKPIVMT